MDSIYDNDSSVLSHSKSDLISQRSATRCDHGIPLHSNRFLVTEYYLHTSSKSITIYKQNEYEYGIKQR